MHAAPCHFFLLSHLFSSTICRNVQTQSAKAEVLPRFRSSREENSVLIYSFEADFLPGGPKTWTLRTGFEHRALKASSARFGACWWQKYKLHELYSLRYKKEF